MEVPVDDCWLTVGTIKQWIADYNLSDDTKVFVQMPDRMTIPDLEKANLHTPMRIESEVDGPSHYVRAWGPCLMLKEKHPNLYLEIYY